MDHLVVLALVSSAITQNKGEALSQLQQATKEFLPEVLWMSLFKSSSSSTHVANRDVGCHLIHIHDVIDPTDLRRRRVAAATLRYDVNKGGTVALLPVMCVPWDAWFRLPDSAAAATLSGTFVVDLGNKKPSLLHPTTEFVKAFFLDEGNVRSALTAYLSMTGRCPYPRSSRRNIAILSALRETMDLYFSTAVATNQQQRAIETQRSQLFPVLVTAACVLGMIELANDDECMQVHSSPFLQCKPDDTTSNDQPLLLVATTTSQQLVALGTGHFTDFLRDDNEESWRMNSSSDAEVWEVNCSIDTTTGVVTALCDLNAGDVCTYK
ncbi:Hypothetical protein, putative [Bodo saltans]|uniref:Uncharacterized protein n=1 Tax=Bodo saltans TaxID=75058 RepID=A0A0S4KLB4_BODSA|nr:Hypothetical protein, putative [Bodo saltans]|eukprot:CUI15374.1 Hypothetical protein, putative [Bodo saltans]